MTLAYPVQGLDPRRPESGYRPPSPDWDGGVKPGYFSFCDALLACRHPGPRAFRKPRLPVPRNRKPVGSDTTLVPQALEPFRDRRGSQRRGCCGTQMRRADALNPSQPGMNPDGVPIERDSITRFTHSRESNATPRKRVADRRDLGGSGGGHGLVEHVPSAKGGARASAHGAVRHGRWCPAPLL